jgi:ABC-type glycerol-3-phosphate transport system substrate-binding protein
MEEHPMHPDRLPAVSGRSVNRRRFLCLIGLGAGASLLVACQQGGSTAAPTTAPAAKPTTAPAGGGGATQPTSQAPAQAQGNAALSGDITHWGWAGSLDMLKDNLALFNQAYPNVKVNLVEMASNDVRDKLLVSLAAGTGAPDSSGLQDRFIPLLIDKGGLVDLTDRVSEFKDKFAQYKWSAYADEKGRYYAMPWDSSPMGMHYRFDIWEADGLETDPDRLADKVQTYDNLIELAKGLKGDHKLMTLSTNQSLNRTNSDDFIEGLLIQNEAHMFDESGKVRDPNPRAIEVLKLLKRMADSGVTMDLGRDDAAPWGQAVKDGRITGEPNAVWAMTFILPAAPETKGKWHVFKLPVLEKGGKRSSLNGGSAVFVTEQSKNKDAAFAFIQFMMTNVPVLANGWTKRQIFPAYLPAFDDPAFNQPDPNFGGQMSAKFFSGVLSEVPPMTYTSHYLDAHGAALDAVTAMFKGKAPEEAWAEATARAKRST